MKRPRTFGFLLTPGFTLLGFSNAVETLREANRILGWQAYRWHTLSTDGGAVRASSGVCVGVQSAVISAPRCDAAFVCADWDLENAATPEVCRWLQALDRRDCMLGGLAQGRTYLRAPMSSMVDAALFIGNQRRLLQIAFHMCAHRAESTKQTNGCIPAPAV